MHTGLLQTVQGQQGNDIGWWIRTETYWIWWIPESYLRKSPQKLTRNHATFEKINKKIIKYISLVN